LHIFGTPYDSRFGQQLTFALYISFILESELVIVQLQIMICDIIWGRESALQGGPDGCPEKRFSRKLKEYVLKTAKEQRIKSIRLWFTESWVFKEFRHTGRELELALEDGVGFRCSSIQGFVRIDGKRYDRPCRDPATFSIIPWGLRNKPQMAVCFVISIPLIKTFRR